MTQYTECTKACRLQTLSAVCRKSVSSATIYNYCIYNFYKYHTQCTRKRTIFTHNVHSDTHLHFQPHKHTDTMLSLRGRQQQWGNTFRQNIYCYSHCLVTLFHSFHSKCFWVIWLILDRDIQSRWNHCPSVYSVSFTSMKRRDIIFLYICMSNASPHIISSFRLVPRLCWCIHYTWQYFAITFPAFFFFFFTCFI